MAEEGAASDRTGKTKSSKGHSWAYTDLKLVRRSDGEVRLLASTSDHELIFVDPTPSATESNASEDAVFQSPLRAKVRLRNTARQNGHRNAAFSFFFSFFFFFCLAMCVVAHHPPTLYQLGRVE